MNFQKIAIVGLGLIGGSLAAALKRKNVATHLIGIDYEDVVAKALSRGLLAEGYDLTNIETGLSRANLIILATPINCILDLLCEISDKVKDGTLITDVGSTKVKIIETAKKRLPEGVYFLGGHPMTGAEKSGLDHVDAFLFENAVYVLAENSYVPSELVARFVDLIETIGAKVIFLSAKLHDEIAAVVSHLPQILAITLMNYATKLNKKNSAYLQLAAGGFRDMTRVASSPYEIWDDILKTNEENINLAIRQFVEELKTMGHLLSMSKLEAIFNDAAQNRLSIPKDTRGFLKRHFDISVVVEDKPGVIAAIATILADKKINIKDIEVLKVREGDAGTLRLAFESSDDREQAITLLTNAGFQAAKRE